MANIHTWAFCWRGWTNFEGRLGTSRNARKMAEFCYHWFALIIIIAVIIRHLNVMVVVATIFHSQSLTFPIFYDNDGDGDDDDEDEEFHLFILQNILCLVCVMWAICCSTKVRCIGRWRCSVLFDPKIDQSDPSLQIWNGQYHQYHHSMTARFTYPYHKIYPFLDMSLKCPISIHLQWNVTSSKWA